MTHWLKTREKSWIDKECCFLHSVCFTPTPSSFPSFTSPSFSLSFSLSQQSRSVPLIILLFLSSLRLTLADKYSSFSRQQRDWIWFSLLVWMKLLTTANTEWVLVVIWHKHCLHIYTSVEHSQCVRPRLAEFKIKTINNRRTLKPHAWLIVVWLSGWGFNSRRWPNVGKFCNLSLDKGLCCWFIDQQDLEWNKNHCNWTEA